MTELKRTFCHVVLSPLQREALLQTIAAEGLEGWNPTDENIADLVSLLIDRLSFGEYLGKYLVQFRDPQARNARRIFARRRPYLIPGTTVLRNSFGVSDAIVLQQLEFVATAGRILGIHGHLGAEISPDPHVIHQHIFGDVYPWAGKSRITDLRRGNSVFATVDRIDERMGRIREFATAIVDDGKALSDSELAYQLAGLYAVYNHTHPFREGNGRAGTMFLQLISQRCGRELDLTTIRREDWIQASRDSMPFRRDGEPEHRPFLGLMNRAVGPRT